MLVNTYDIINAGPKNRFLCSGRIISNSGRIFQPQNLPRPQFKNHIIDGFIDHVKSGNADLLYENVTKLSSSALRGSLIADAGKKLVVSDLSSIEGRVLAWLAGEEWKIKAYEEIDKGIGYDMYILTYARTFSVPAESVNDDQRQLGKTLELALGFGGGVGSFLTFARVYKINLDDLIKVKLPNSIKKQAEEFYEVCKKEKRTHSLSKEVFIACDGIKRMWRESNPMIVKFWKDLGIAVREVLNETVDKVQVGHVTIDKVKAWLRIKLPSGRYICYPNMKTNEGKLTYLGVNQYTKKFERLSIYDGKFAANITQSTARDVLKHAEHLANTLGYEVVLPVHDELVTETPDTKEFSEKGLSKIMSTQPSWALDLPLAAKGFESYRYKKG